MLGGWGVDFDNDAKRHERACGRGGGQQEEEEGRFPATKDREDVCRLLKFLDKKQLSEPSGHATPSDIGSTIVQRAAGCLRPYLWTLDIFFHHCLHLSCLLIYVQ